MAKNDTPSSASSSSSTSTLISTPPITSPPNAEAKTIDGLKIVHESPERAPKQKEQVEEKPMSREQLLEQASKFLESAPIKNAPLKEKLEFLHTKGLTKDETEALLAKLEEKATGKAPTVEEKGKGKELTKIASSTTTTTTTPPNPTPAPAQAPIVTYPEFLTPAPPPPPPPLLTAKSLGKALYFASGAAATIYGANKFVFTPMYDALTTARLDLSSTALTNLNNFNTRLRLLVPDSPRTSSAPAHDSDTDSDPGEMFHVDAQTQTSPSLEHDSDELLSPDAKLEHLGRQLETLVESHSDGADNELTFALQEMTSYLETLTYEVPGLGLFLSPYGGYGQGVGKEKEKDEMIAKVKAEIRGVKGVLLNSKNFPASR